MRKFAHGKSFVSAALIWMLAVVPLVAQTRVTMPKNKYKVQDDVKLGRDASNQVSRQFPMLNDSQTDRYVESVGQRLVRAIPTEFNQPAFDYQFAVVNARDINAFALPGGPMYVNRGMIEAAKNEGEMAGVMAHEISHVALRHATAQQTKLSNPLNQVLGIGAILGGAILGGQAGAQAGQIFAAGYFLKYSRDYETQADILGSRIMADAGYDPRDLANMFRTIEQQGGGGGRAPEWLSSHPNPGNRYQNINREAGLLNVSSPPIKITREFSRVQERLRAMPRAKSMSEIQRDYERTGGQNSQVMSGNYSRNVAYPSTRMRTFSNNAMSVSVPSNWQEFNTSGQIWFAPDGAYGNQGITHGAMIGASRANSTSLTQATQQYIQELLQANSYLRQAYATQRANVAGRSGLATVLSGRSPVTGRTENVTVYTAQLRSGDLFFVAAVAPEEESSRYSPVFRNMVSSIRVND